MFERVLWLRGQSYLCREIIEEIQDQFGVRLAKETISYWVRGISSPLNSGHLFNPKPIPELAYVIGVETGDAYLNEKRNNYQYRIILRAVDVDFVEAFNQAVAKVLGCSPHKLWKGKNVRETVVEFGSYLLHKFLSQPLGQLKVFIEHCEDCAAAFLRGFFDSEGSVDTNGHVTASNTDTILLRYVQYLLKIFFHIEATGPHLGKRKGTILTRRGKSYVRRSDCFSIYVRTSFLKAFDQEIGLTIGRKKVRLENALGRRGQISR
jgi:intein-encoded DNA endonuclease-like protein